MTVVAGRRDLSSKVERHVDAAQRAVCRSV